MILHGLQDCLLKRIQLIFATGDHLRCKKEQSPCLPPHLISIYHKRCHKGLKTQLLFAVLLFHDQSLFVFEAEFLFNASNPEMFTISRSTKIIATEIRDKLNKRYTSGAQGDAEIQTHINSLNFNNLPIIKTLMRCSSTDKLSVIEICERARRVKNDSIIGHWQDSILLFLSSLRSFHNDQIKALQFQDKQFLFNYFIIDLVNFEQILHRLKINSPNPPRNQQLAQPPKFCMPRKP